MDTNNNKPGFWRRTGEVLGFVERAAVQSVAAYPTRQAYSQAGTTSNALTISGVYRAVTIHTTAAAQLSLKAFRGGRVAALPAFVRRPDVTGQLSQFIESTMRSLLLDGNAYWFVEYMEDGLTVKGLQVLNPNAMQVTMVAGQIQYHYTYDQGMTVVFNASQIQHIAINKDGFSLVGAGPIQYARRSIEGMLDQREYADNWFKRSGVPAGYLSNDQNMNPAEAYAQWMQYLEERGTSTGVLTGGWKYNLISLNPADAMWIESQQFSVTEIARWFGVPPTYLLAAVDGSTNTYSNMEQVDTAYVRLSLMQYLVKIEEAFTSLAKGTLVIKFDTSGLLRADQATRFTNHAVALNNGFMTVNEVRALEGLPPVPGGDELKGSSPDPVQPIDPVQPVDGNTAGDTTNTNGN